MTEGATKFEVLEDKARELPSLFSGSLGDILKGFVCW